MSWKMYWMTFWWPWPKVTALINKNLLVCWRKWEPLNQSLQNLVAISLWSYLSADKILDVFYQGQTLYWTYLRNGWSDWCETKRRCIGWILGELCDLDLWPHPWPWPCSFKVKVLNSLIWGIWGGGADWHGTKGMLVNHDRDCDLWITMVGWVDVPYSDWCDFGRRRAVNISSSFNKWLGACIRVLFLHLITIVGNGMENNQKHYCEG